MLLAISQPSQLMSTQNKTYFGRDLEAMSFAKNYHGWIIDELSPYLGEDVAEVGAGNGNFTALLTDYVAHLTAFEPSENMYPLLRDRFSQNHRVRTINDFFGEEYSSPNKHFSSILYINVLEHIEKDSKELTHVYRALKHGGYALIFVPALSCLYSDLDKKLGHFRRYHKKELSILAENAGFNVLQLKYFDLVGIIPWYVAFVLAKASLTSGNVSIYDQLVVPFMKKIERRFTPPIGKNLLLIAQKA